MAITSRKVAGLAVAAFALVGLVLRLWQHNAVFPEADEAIWAGLPLKLHTHPFFLPGGLRDNPLAQLAAWQYGYLYPCVLLLWVKFLSLAGLCVNEVVMILPCIAIGTASIALAYYVAREFFGYRAGLLCAAFTAVLPLHVGLSRTMITTRIPASFLQMLTILLFVRLMKGGSKKSAWLAGFALAAYCVSNPMFPGTLAVLLLIAFLYAGDNAGTFPERIRETFRRVFRKELVLPPLLALLPSLVVLVYGLHMGQFGGQLGYILGKEKDTGWYFSAVVRHCIDNCGPALAVLIPIGLLYALRQVLRNRKEETILLAWALLAFVPWIFLIPDRVTSTREYLLDGTMASLILISGMIIRGVGLLESKGRAGIAKLVHVTALALVPATAVSTLALVFNMRCDGTMVRTPYMDQPQRVVFGSVREDNGLKVAGYYVREQVSPEKKVFLDMTPYHGPLYFGREVYAAGDAGPEKMRIYLERVKDRMDFVVVNTINEDVIRRAIGERFHKIVDIRNGDRSVMAIYAVEPREPVLLKVEDVNREFDKKYGTAEKLIPTSLNYPEQGVMRLE